MKSNYKIIQECKRLGFSLLELLTTIAIIAVIVTAAIPSFSRLIQKNRLKAAAENLYQKIIYARSESIKQNVDVNVVFQPGSNWCVGFTTDASCNCQIQNACNLGQYSKTNFKQVALTSTGFSSNEITFDHIRGSVNDSGTLGFSLNGRTLKIKISRLGAPRLCSDTLGGYKSCV